ncbi:hypothetical protein [Ensifer adhaerens]|uniref:hypothetical protein n=1 Tax=Ensifer adhaerens TaxID=106592 RepID=UPI00098F50F6|nr:hypothetical protein [Ensifer adhaerens]
MRIDWSNIVFMIALGLFSFVLGITHGAAVWSVGVEQSAPFGRVEFWLNRYQTLIAGGIALLTLYGVVHQLRQSERQHKENIYRQLEPELYGLYDAFRAAKGVELDEIQGLAEEDHLMILNNLTAMDPETVAYIEAHCIKYVADEARRFMQSQSQLNDFLADKSTTLKPRVFQYRKLKQRAERLERLSKIRMKEIEQLRYKDGQKLF